MRRGSARRATLPALLAVVVAVALAQTATTFTLKRDGTDLVVANLSRAADGARSIGNNQNCEAGAKLTLVYGPAPGRVETRVEDTLLTSTLAVIRAPAGGDSVEGQESLTLTDEAVTFSRPGCLDERESAAEPTVTLVQGRTTVNGTRFFLDTGEDVGEMDGPIALTREADGGGAPLVAEALSMTFAVGEQRATLLGDVRVTSQDRVTTGESLELDEDAGTAVMRGSPARSEKGSDVLQGDRLLYYLDSDDVVVLGNVSGDLTIDLE